MSAAEVMSASKPKAQPPLTEAQLKDFRIATNRVSLESIRYLAGIVGYTDLVTATITTLEKLVQGSASTSDCLV